MERFIPAFRAALLSLARLLGTRVVDARTGRVLGRALMIPYRGRVHVIGLEATVVPEFVPQKDLNYWKQDLGFTAHLPPDFPHEPGA